MTAREYFKKLESISYKLKDREEQLETMKQRAMAPAGSGTDGERVQHTVEEDAVGRNVRRYLKLEEEVSEIKERLECEKNKMIGKIHALDDWRYREVLFKRYVQFKRFKTIAKEMNYAEDYIRALHTKAMHQFAVKYHFKTKSKEHTKSHI